LVLLIAEDTNYAARVSDSVGYFERVYPHHQVGGQGFFNSLCRNLGSVASFFEDRVKVVFPDAKASESTALVGFIWHPVIPKTLEKYLGKKSYKPLLLIWC
jgi:hypothetical protein